MPVPREVLLREVSEVEALLSLLTERVDGELLDSAPRLKVVSNMAVGYDNVDVDEATRRGIAVCNTPGVLTETTADFAFALLMAAARRLVEGDRYTREGRWKTWGPMLLLGQDVHHATLGLIGLGRIGVEMAKRAAGFSMRIQYYDPVRREDLEHQYGLTYVGFETLLRESDFISLHTPLTEATHHLIGEPQLRLMKNTAILINTSRGPVVDQKALYEALAHGVIGGAALDVTEKEPIDPDDSLLTLENVIVAPHIASASVKTRTSMAVLAAENLIAVLDGRTPQAIVNPEVLGRQAYRMHHRGE